MTARFARYVVLTLLCATSQAIAQGTAMGVAATAGETATIRDGVYNLLRQADAVEPGTRLMTGQRGRLAMRLEPVGLLSLGDASRVLVHSIEPVDPPARMHLVRLVVEAGSLQADSRPRAGNVPADLRINFAALRLRVFGAAVWMERTPAYDEVCLLGGAVELQTPAGPQRLDEPGSCLRVTASGLQHLDPAAAGPIEPRLLRTAVDARAYPMPAPLAEITTPSLPRPPPPPAAAAPEPAPEPEPEPEPEPTIAPSEPAVAMAEEPTTGAWTIVLASVPERERAEREAERLRKLGLETRVVEASRTGGTMTWRVVSGSYVEKGDAAADIAAIRARRGLSRAWLTQVP
jgi:cell division septation protein DedD